MRAFRFALILILLPVAWSAALADELTTRDGRTFKAAVEEFRSETGKQYFTVRLPESPGSSHPVELDHVAMIEFHEAGALPGSGRNAVVEFQEDNTTQTLLIEAAFRQEQNFVFRASDNKLIQSQTASRIVFDPFAPKPTPTPVQPAERGPIREPEFSFLVPAPAGMVLNPPEGAPTDSDLVDGFGPGGDSPKADDFLHRQLHRVPLVNLRIRMIDLLIFLLLGTYAGGTYLRFASRVEGEPPLQLARAFRLALGLLAIAVATYGLFSLIPLFGKLLGLIAGFFLCRVVLMGMLEVLEEKANQLLLMFFAIQAILLCLITGAGHALW